MELLSPAGNVEKLKYAYLYGADARITSYNVCYTKLLRIDQPGRIADFFSSILNIDRNDQQKILETLDVQARLEAVLIYIKKEQELMKIQRKIQNQINEKIEKNQREYFLKEELKARKLLRLKPLQTPNPLQTNSTSPAPQLAVL